MAVLNLFLVKLRHGSANSHTWHQTAAGGQLYTPSTLHLEKEPILPIEEEAGLVPVLVLSLWRTEQIMPLLGLDSRFPGHPTCSLVAVLSGTTRCAC